MNESMLVAAARELCDEVATLRFGAPITHVYNPLEYAGANHERYLIRYGQGPKRALLLGMNPGPFGMAQTGVPFGEVAAVRDWLELTFEVGRPPAEHPKRPITGLACPHSEVSGRRLWGAIARHFGAPECFFERYLVINYCPLVFMEASGRNRTPDKLPAAERHPLFEACDRHLERVVRALSPAWVIGVGAFAEARARAALADQAVQIGRICHPSPASPVANRGWEAQVAKELHLQGICPL